MQTAMVGVENRTSNVNGRATRIRWTSLKTNSRRKEPNVSEYLGRGGKQVP